MIPLLKLLADLWIFGVPILIATWAVLRLTASAPGRVRYLLAIGGLLAAVSLPVSLSFRPAGEPDAFASVAPLPSMDTAGSLALPVAVIWLAGTLVLLARDVAGHLQLRRARRGWQPAPAHLAALLAWPSTVPLLVGSAAPLTSGLIKPGVALPAGFADSFPGPVARHIALHELAHARWRDPLVYALLRMVAAIFWIAPLWPFLKWARREREMAADEAALRGASEKEEYVAALLHLARRAGAHRRFATSVAASDLEYRARRILAPRSARLSIVGVAAVILATAVLLNARPAHFAEPVQPAPIIPAVHSPVDAQAASVPDEPVRAVRRRVASAVRPEVRLPGARLIDGVTLTPRARSESPPPAQPPAVHDEPVRVVHPDDEVIVIRNVIRR